MGIFCLFEESEEEAWFDFSSRLVTVNDVLLARRRTTDFDIFVRRWIRVCDEIRVILEAKTCEDRDLSLDAYIWWCIGLSLHALNLNINKELVHADFRHFWLAALVSELIRE